MGRAKEVAEIDGFRNTLDADGEIAARPRKRRFHGFLYPGGLAAAKLPATAKSGDCLYNFGVPSPTLAKSFSRHRVTRGVTGTNDSKSKLFRAKTFDFIEDSDRLDTPEAVLDTMIRVVSRFGFVSGILPKPGETLDDLILAHHSPDGSAAFSCQCMARAVMKLPWRWPALMWISRQRQSPAFTSCRSTPSSGCANCSGEARRQAAAYAARGPRLVGARKIGLGDRDDPFRRQANGR